MTRVVRIYFFLLAVLLISAIGWHTSLQTYSASAGDLIRQGNSGQIQEYVSAVSGLTIQQERLNVFSEENEIESEKLNQPLTYIDAGIGQGITTIILVKIFSYTFKRIPILREHWFYTSTRRHIALRTIVI